MFAYHKFFKVVCIQQIIQDNISTFKAFPLRMASINAARMSGTTGAAGADGGAAVAVVGGGGGGGAGAPVVVCIGGGGGGGGGVGAPEKNFGMTYSHIV